MSVIKRPFGSLALAALCALTIQPAFPQQMSNFDRERAQTMLQVITNDVHKNYYDPKMHGVDWDAKVREGKEKIAKETSFNMAVSPIAATLDTLHDSHTFFTPPQHSYKHDFGWRHQMIGDKCFVVRVKPQSDAEAKDVHPGDEVLSINGYAPSRDNLWKMQYAFSILRPQPGLRLELKNPAGLERTLDVAATVRQLPLVTDLTGNGVWDFVRDAEDKAHSMGARWSEVGNELMILKFPNFFFSQSVAQDMMGRARKHQALIIDLRGNPGGRVDTLGWLVGSMFDHDVKIADRVTRNDTKVVTAKSFGKDTFTGELVVLVDSDSASASEVFARVMQLEKRAVVIGDRSSGSVMESKRYSYHMGSDTMTFYGASITDADLHMKDGNSLEHAGVTPDEVVLPSGADLASGRDPVMTYAAKTLGFNISPEAAGKLFPYEWLKE
jgi:carboxyl-terminal processing protease